MSFPQTRKAWEQLMDTLLSIFLNEWIRWKVKKHGFVRVIIPHGTVITITDEQVTTSSMN